MFLAALALLAGAFFIYRSFQNLEVLALDVRIGIGEKSGIDVNSSALSYGKIVPGTSVLRKVILNNNRDVPIEASIMASEEVRPFLSFESPVFLEPGKNLSIPVSATVPFGMPVENYSGKLFFKIKEAK